MTTWQEAALTEFLGEDVVTWLVEYRTNHAWAIIWGGGQNVVRAWPDPQIGVPCYAEAGDLDAARTEARRIARLIAERQPASYWDQP